MKEKVINTRVINKHDSSVNWDKANNFIPKQGELIIYDDMNKIKIGNNKDNVKTLPFMENGKGQKGDQGLPGGKGDDGFSPTVVTNQSPTGTEVIITDAIGPHKFTIKNGADGKDNAKNASELEATIPPSLPQTGQKNTQAVLNALAEKINNSSNQNCIPNSEKGQPNGVASLDSTGKVPKEQLPTDRGGTDTVFIKAAEIPVPGGTLPGGGLLTKFSLPVSREYIVQKYVEGKRIIISAPLNIEGATYLDSEIYAAGDTSPSTINSAFMVAYDVFDDTYYYTIEVDKENNSTSTLQLSIIIPTYNINTKINTSQLNIQEISDQVLANLPTYHTGTTAPANTLGVDGDIYFQKA